MRLRAVLLDLDGTLLDHESAMTSALHAWLPTLGVRVTEDVLTQWRVALERNLEVWRQGLVTFAEQRRRRLRDFLPAVGVPVDGDDRGVDELFDGYLHSYAASWRAFDDAAAAVTAIRRAGLSCAVLTNGDPEQQTAKLTRIGLLDLAGPVFTPAALGAAKPAAAAFLTVCERLGVPPAAALNVGDRYDLDVQGARAAGLKAVYLDRTDAGPLDDAWRISSLTELSPLLGGLHTKSVQ